MLAYDLECCFLKKGLKRPMTRMLEIGIHSSSIQYQRMINPCDKYQNGSELIDSLEKEHKIKDTLRFWTKLLVEKGHLNSALRRATVEKQADAISLLLRRSDRARKHKKPLDMLYAIENADDPDQFVRTKKCLKPKGTLFYSTSEILKEIFEFDGMWVAHNGKSFDSKIIRGNAERLNIECNVNFKDSLPVFRRHLDEPSYSLGHLYRSVFKKSFKAHHAYEDAKALYQLIEKLGGIKLFQTPVDKIKGVGKKSAEIFSKKNILTTRDLFDYVATHTPEQFEKDFEGVYRLKNLSKRLFAGELQAEFEETIPWRLV